MHLSRDVYNKFFEAIESKRHFAVFYSEAIS
jgi:hypothetical protein